MQALEVGDSGEVGKVGPYRLEAPLGRGGMGTVWRAVDERLKRPVALKRILPEAIDNPRLRERFRREAEAEARLNHPAIVHIYDILETADGDWIVMELVEGRTLRQLLEHEPLPVERAVELGREIAAGLAEAHAHGILHRDLKDCNVMVTEAGHAKILDFGLAKQIEPEDQETTLSLPGTIVGTSYAMSPEQAMGLPLDDRSDLFALGTLLYEMVTGVVPFRAETAAATLARVCNYRQVPARKLRPEMPAELSDLIDRLLEKESVHRPRSAAAVAAELAETAARLGSGEKRPGSPPDATEEATLVEARFQPSPSVEKTVRSASSATGFKLPRVALGGGVALVLLALLLALLLTHRSAPGTPAAPDRLVLYRRGEQYLARFDKAGNLDAAIASFEAALARDGRYAPAYAGLARAAWLKFDNGHDATWLNRARGAAQRAVDLDGYLAAARVSQGLVDVSSGQLDPAQRELEQALRLEPSNADAYFGLGRLQEKRGELEKAEAAYRKAAELRPDRLFLDERGRVDLRRGRTAEAIQAFRRSIELAPDGYMGYMNLGVAYYSQGKLAEAATQFQKALEIQPEATLYSNLATVLFDEGFYDQSAAAYEKALAMPGAANKYMMWANLGDAYRQVPGKGEEAGKAYRRALQLLQESLTSTPGDVTLQSRQALYWARAGEQGRALARSAEIEKLSPREPAVWYRLAQTYEICKEREKALAALDRALRAGKSLSEVKSDPDLLGLREDVRYHRLAAGYESSS